MTLHVEDECPDGTPFPVDWPDAEMAKFGWRWDQLHEPTPMTPLAQDFLGYKAAGLTAGGLAIGRPLSAERVFANGYAFGRPQPLAADQIAHLAVVAEREVGEQLGRLLELWEREHRPEVEAIFSAFQRWALEDESLRELMSRFEEMAALARRLGELHNLSFGRAMGARAPLEAFCDAEFGAAGAQIASEAIGGMPNKSLESAEKLWDLSREALARPAVAELVRESASATFLDGLDAAEGGCRVPGVIRRLPRCLGAPQRVVLGARLPDVARRPAVRGLPAQELPRGSGGAEPGLAARAHGGEARGADRGGAAAAE